jgi:GAF domain-containing protein
MEKTNSLNEFLRLRDLYSYQILDTPPEEDYDELVELSAMICNCSMSLISFVDKDRQWFKAKIGVEITETSLDLAFCNHTIKQDDVFIVQNPLEDDMFKNHLMVTGGIRIRYYAGAPIYSSMGNKIGTICVLDKRDKVLLPKQIDALKKLSRQASRLLELRSKNRLLEKLLEENALRELPA